MDFHSGLEYVKLYKDLKTALPQLKKNQDKPEDPETQSRAIQFLWALKVLYGKIKVNKEIQIPHLEFLEKLDQMPNDKAEFENAVKQNMLEVRNNTLCIKNPTGESEPIGDFGSKTLNEIENWALAAIGTFGKK